MAFTYNNATKDGKIRLLIHDTTAVNAAFTDAEITDFRTMADGNIFLAASLALRSMAVSMKGFAFKTGDLSIDKSKAVNALKDLADDYEAKAYKSPGEWVDSFLYEIDKVGDDLSQYINDPQLLS